MKTLSLYDGMSCAAIALTELGITLTRYVAFENDPHAVKVSQHNFFLEAEHRGEITPDTDFSEFEGFDFVMGGSPCTLWSIAQSPDKRETTASGIGWELFQHYVRAVEQAKPKYFIYENNKSMSKDIRKSIDEAFGFEAVLINSALVSAQNRNRLYWVGKRNEQGGYDKVNIEQPEDRGILLKDILDNATSPRDKALCLNHNAGNNRDYFEKSQNNVVFGAVKCVNSQSGDRYGKRPQPSVHDRIYDENGKHPCFHTAHQPSVAVRVGDLPNGEGVISGSQATRVYSHEGKAVNQVANGGGQGAKTGLYAIPTAVAQRGRYNDTGNRHSKTEGEITQHFEARSDGKTNALTTVQKDNGVAEPINVTAEGKAQCLRATYYKDGIRNIVGNDIDRKTGVAEPIQVTEDGKSRPLQASYFKYAASDSFKATNPRTGVAIPVYHYHLHTDEPIISGEVYEVTTHDGTIEKHKVYGVKDGRITLTIKGEQRTYPIKLADGYYIIRKLTVSECMRLQQVPEWYDFSVISNTQAYKCLGNGWSIEVIKHLIQGCLVTP